MKFSINKLLCLLLSLCIISSVLALPALASFTPDADYNEVDQKKLQTAIYSLQTPIVEGPELAQHIYRNAFSFNFNMKATVKEVLDQVFINGYSQDELESDKASATSSIVVVNVMEMILPTLYSEIPANLSAYFDGDPAENPTSASLVIGDLLLMEKDGECSIYIYDGNYFAKLVKPQLIREDADILLSSAKNADRYVVLRPSRVLSPVFRSTEETDVLTDAQKALIGTAESYLLRGHSIQYDDATPFTKNSYRWNTGLRTPEEARPDDISYINCAAFTSEVYKTALGIDDVRFTTSSLIKDPDVVWSHPKNINNSIGGETEEQKSEIEADFYNNLQPGDIITIRYISGGGHAMLYIGNGNIIHSTGSSYSFSKGEISEATIRYMRVEEFFDSTSRRHVFSKLTKFFIVRPLRDWNGTVPENTINRITTMKGIVGEKISSKNRFSTVNPGDEITYTFRVFNSNPETKTLDILDTVPENTTFVSGGLEYNNGILSYSMTVAPFETKEVSYTVKVNENTPYGTWITSNSATIGGVLHKTYEVPVRNTLTPAQQSAISDAIEANSALASSTDKGIAYANEIYKDVIGVDAVLDHTSVIDIKNNLMPVIDEDTVIEGVTTASYLGYYHLDYKSHYAKMLVPRMFGGRKIVTELHQDKIIQKLYKSQFVNGDILLIESSAGKTNLYMYNNEKVLNLSTGNYESSTDKFFDMMFANYRFAVLRPSMTDTYDYVEPEKTPLEIAIAELDKINKATITDDTSLAAVEALVAEIDAYLAANPSETMKPSQQTIYTTAKTNIYDYKNPAQHITAKGKVWFDLKGNARLFVSESDEAWTNRTEYNNYLPGVDFAGYLQTPTGDFATDQAAVVSSKFGGAMFVYNTKSSSTSVKLTVEDNNHYFTVNDEKYLVRPKQNVLKIAKKTVTTSSLPSSETETIARYQSLNGEKTIDIPDGKYSSVGFLGGAMLKYTKQIAVTLVYEDTEVDYGNVLQKYAKTYVSGTDGTIYLRNFTNIENDMSDAAYDFQVQNITTDSSKILTAIKVEDVGLNGSGSSKNHAIPYYIISAWGVSAEEPDVPQPSTLDVLITELDALNTAGINDDDALSEVEAKVAEIDAYLTANALTLTDQQKTVYDLAKETIEAYKNAQTTDDKSIYAQGKIWFDLNGNSKFFATKEDEQWTNRATYSDFLPGVDYSGYLLSPTGDFTTDQAAIASTGKGGSFFRYTLDAGTTLIKTSDPDFKTGEDGNIYWTIKGVDYLIRVNEKIIKNLHTTIKTTALNDAAMIKRYTSLNDPHTINVPDKKYESVGLLAGAKLNYYKRLKVSLYYEGSSEPVVYEGDDMKMIVATATSPADGTMYLRSFKDTSNSQKGGGSYFVPIEIQTDSTKTLTRIVLDDAGTNNPNEPFYVISAWGVEKSDISGELSLVKNTEAETGKLISATVNYTVNNPSGLAGENYTVIIVCYDQNNHLCGKQISPYSTQDGQKEISSSTTYEVPENTVSVKAFLWKDLATMTPMASYK